MFFFSVSQILGKLPVTVEHLRSTTLGRLVARIVQNSNKYAGSRLLRFTSLASSVDLAPVPFADVNKLAETINAKWRSLVEAERVKKEEEDKKVAALAAQDLIRKRPDTNLTEGRSE